jgi:NAD+ synthase
MDLIPKLQQDAEAVLTEFIRHKVASAGAKGLVLGLSGGVDSAVVMALGVKALGKGRVHPFFLPERQSPTGDLADVNMLARLFGVRLKVWDISGMLDAAVEAFGSGGRGTNTAKGNLKARSRMVALYHEANRLDCLVAGTGNKTELLVGYFTKFGDGASDVAPIGDLYKTQVWELARRLGIPGRIISKVPTAGLYPGQTDEGELGIRYQVLDQLLYGLDLGLSPAQVLANVRPKGAADG